MAELRIISISGKPGLYKLLTTTKSGIIAQSLIDNKRVMSPFTNISALDEIAVYTYDEEVPLWQVFQKIATKEDYKTSIDHKSAKNELEAYFREILPDYDEDKLYPSHMKKIVQWYNILQQSEVLKDFISAKVAQQEALDKEEQKKETE